MLTLTRLDGVVDLNRLEIGAPVSEPLLVWDVEQRSAGTQPFVVLTLGNCKGRLQSAPFWPEDLPKLEGIERGAVVSVHGEIATYRERRQLKVAQIRPLPRDGVAWPALMPSVGDTRTYWDQLDQWRHGTSAPRLRSVLDLFYEDSEFRQAYGECPASLSGHHARLGGLLQHTCEVARIGLCLAETTGADRDLVLAGALLHDIGKLESYTWSGTFAMTDRGSLCGHVVLGSLMLAARLGAAPPTLCSGPEHNLLHHLILSHHGLLEHGAPVTPMTLEAEVLHFADNASARTGSMGEALEDPQNFSGTDPVSARPVWQLDRRRVYRGKSDWGRK
ncbi:MAG TPA: HD domain-containing protein [Gemmatimonadales bacterium]|jgi:3'-5' exoribonuclease|nr:HD domain-containing protein [Gemmatimonadales bacterium]